ncbi:MAG: hypothetical protein HOQ21_02725 [Dermatophilaceae bacterium]|nr:hypothetical protein [Dermatophilaceae bacterium]
MTNFYAKERRHHNLKTHRVWTSNPAADGGLEWTTLTGRTYTTYPKDWRKGLGPPPETSPPDPLLAQDDPSERPARLADLADDPPPF